MIPRDDGMLPVQPVHGRLGGSALEVEVPATGPSPTGARQAEGEPGAPGEIARALRNPRVGEALRERLETRDARLSFDVDDESGKMVVRLTDPDTGRVIRQIPAEEMLQIARSIDKYLGLLVDLQR